MTSRAIEYIAAKDIPEWEKLTNPDRYAPTRQDYTLPAPAGASPYPDSYYILPELRNFQYIWVPRGTVPEYTQPLTLYYEKGDDMTYLPRRAHDAQGEEYVVCYTSSHGMLMRILKTMSLIPGGHTRGCLIPPNLSDLAHAAPDEQRRITENALDELHEEYIAAAKSAQEAAARLDFCQLLQYGRDISFTENDDACIAPNYTLMTFDYLWNEKIAGNTDLPAWLTANISKVWKLSNSLRWQFILHRCRELGLSPSTAADALKARAVMTGGAVPALAPLRFASRFFCHQVVPAVTSTVPAATTMLYSDARKAYMENSEKAANQHDGSYIHPVLAAETDKILQECSLPEQTTLFPETSIPAAKAYGAAGRISESTDYDPISAAMVPAFLPAGLTASQAAHTSALQHADAKCALKGLVESTAENNGSTEANGIAAGRSTLILPQRQQGLAHSRRLGGIVLYGKHHTFKTEAAVCLLHMLMEVGMKCHMVHMSSFEADYLHGLGCKERQEHLKEVPLLLIDDLGAEKNHQKIASILHQRTNAGLINIITTNLNLSALEQTYTHSIWLQLQAAASFIRFAA